MLACLHVDAVDGLHQPHGVLIDPGLGLGTGGVAFEHIGSQLPAQGFGDLAAAGIVDADKGDFFHHSFSFALILQIIWVMVPMGQKVHQVRGLNRAMTKRPMMVEVSIML